MTYLCRRRPLAVVGYHRIPSLVHFCRHITFNTVSITWNSLLHREEYITISTTYKYDTTIYEFRNNTIKCYQSTAINIITIIIIYVFYNY
jgi:hypothetical protein